MGANVLSRACTSCLLTFWPGGKPELIKNLMGEPIGLRVPSAWTRLLSLLCSGNYAADRSCRYTGWCSRNVDLLNAHHIASDVFYVLSFSIPTFLSERPDPQRVYVRVRVRSMPHVQPSPSVFLRPTRQRSRWKHCWFVMIDALGNALASWEVVYEMEYAPISSARRGKLLTFWHENMRLRMTAASIITRIWTDCIPIMPSISLLWEAAARLTHRTGFEESLPPFGSRSVHYDWHMLCI